MLKTVAIIGTVIANQKAKKVSEKQKAARMLNRERFRFAWALAKRAVDEHQEQNQVNMLTGRLAKMPAARDYFPQAYREACELYTADQLEAEQKKLENSYFEVHVVRKELLNRLKGLTVPALVVRAVTDANGEYIAITTKDANLAKDKPSMADVVPAQVVRPGAICIGAKLLRDMIASLDSDVIRLAASLDGRLTIGTDMSYFSVEVDMCIDHEPQPTLENGFLEFCAASFIQDVESLKRTINKKEYNSFKSFVFFEISESLTMVSTDGHRMTESTGIQIVNDTSEFGSFLVPFYLVTEVAKALKKDKAIKTIKVSMRKHPAANIFSFHVGNQVFTADESITKFPDFRKATARHDDVSFEVDRKELVSKLKAAEKAWLAHLDGSKNCRPFELLGDRDTLTLSNQNPVNRFSDSISVDTGSEGFRVGFNPTYLYELISSLKETVIRLSFDMGSPITITVPGREGFKQVLMPMRLDR